MVDDKSQTSEQPLSPIVGHELNSVVFIRDYLQLHFEGSGLTVLVWPAIKVGENWTRWGMPGYRDKLCERIGKVVRAASVIEGQEIRIEFDDDSMITVSLKPEDRYIDEAAIFNNGPEEIWVW
jgi:hypothetical protein